MHPFFSLRKKLPAINFDFNNGVDAAKIPELQSYLDFYQLRFDKEVCSQYTAGNFSVAGYEMVSQCWTPAGNSLRGTVFLLHGYYDHAGLFRHLIDFLLSEKFCVVAYDQPGHGLSSGEQASIRDFSEYASAWQHVQTLASGMPQPWYAIGQSTGAAVILHSLLLDRQRNPFQKIILMAPLIRPAHWERSSWLYRLLAPWTSSVPRRFARNSHDEIFLRFVRDEDPLQSRHLKTTWVKAMKKWLDGFPRLLPRTMAVLVIQGDADETVDWRYNLPQLKSRIPGLEVFCLSGARHHLANERQDFRQPVFAKISQYLDESMGNKQVSL